MRPQAVKRPGSVEQLAAIVRRAASEGTEVAIRGGGHSQSGQCLTDGGIVIDTSALDAVSVSDGGDTLRAQGGARWGAVIDALEGTGRLPHVLVDTGGATVGGTLSAGGAGTGSHRDGAQVEHVTGLEVITGTGEWVRCSPSVEPALFDAVRAGQGMFGIITEASMRLRAVRARVRHWALGYRDRERFAHDFASLARSSRLEHLKAEIRVHEGRAVIHAGAEYDKKADTEEALDGLGYDTARVTRDSAHVGRAGLIPEARFDQAHYHPWRDWFLPEGTLATIIAPQWIDPKWVPAPPRCWIGTYALAEGPIEAPAFMRPEGTRWVTYSVLASVEDGNEALEIAHRLEAMDTQIEALGGKSYLSGKIGDGHERWRRHYGAQNATMCACRARFDPAGIFKNKHLQARQGEAQ